MLHGDHPTAVFLSFKISNSSSQCFLVYFQLPEWSLGPCHPPSTQVLRRALEPKTSIETPSLSSLFQLGHAMLKSLLPCTCFLLILERMMDYIAASALPCYNVYNLIHFFLHCKLMAILWQDQPFIMNSTLFPGSLDAKRSTSVYNYQDTKKHLCKNPMMASWPKREESLRGLLSFFW